MVRGNRKLGKNSIKICESALFRSLPSSTKNYFHPRDDDHGKKGGSSGTRSQFFGPFSGRFAEIKYPAHFIRQTVSRHCPAENPKAQRSGECSSTASAASDRLQTFFNAPLRVSALIYLTPSSLRDEQFSSFEFVLSTKQSDHNKRFPIIVVTILFLQNPNLFRFLLLLFFKLIIKLAIFLKGINILKFQFNLSACDSYVATHIFSIQEPYPRVKPVFEISGA